MSSRDFCRILVLVTVACASGCPYGAAQAPPTPVPASVAAAVRPQQFICDTGYKIDDCRRDIALVKRALDRYHADQLGQWTWVLVRSEQWKELLRSRELDADTPAFTYLAKRQTFLEDALVNSNARRSAELMLHWSTPSDDLLDLAITHELGHAVCNERDERKADRYGKALRQGKHAQCESRD